MDSKSLAIDSIVPVDKCPMFSAYFFCDNVARFVEEGNEE
jgi:hypothetical protein